jgi:hypothetical protein
MGRTILGRDKEDTEPGALTVEERIPLIFDNTKSSRRKRLKQRLYEMEEASKVTKDSTNPSAAVFSRLRPINTNDPDKIDKDLLAASPISGKGFIKGNKNQVSGKPFTSRFRGVHRTVPTKRWEAQFRKDGKPTSLGCFDSEESAAIAYDKMMIWCELHQRGGNKGCLTNFEPERYKDDLAWLQSISQDELLKELRKKGREEAASRWDRIKQQGKGSVQK